MDSVDASIADIKQINIEQGVNAQLVNEKSVTTYITTDAMSLQDKIACTNDIPFTVSCPEFDQQGHALFITANGRFKTALIVTFRKIDRTSKSKEDICAATKELMKCMGKFLRET